MTLFAYFFVSTFISILFVIIFYEWRKRTIDKLTENIPGLPSFSIIGSIPLLWGREDGFLSVLLILFALFNFKTFKCWFGPHLTIFAADPEDVKIVLNEPACLEKSGLYSVINRYVKNSIFTAPVDTWRVHKSVIAASFSNQHLKDSAPIIYEKNLKMANKLKSLAGTNELFDIHKYIAYTTFDAVCGLFLGRDLERMETDNPGITEHFDKVVRDVAVKSANRYVNIFLYPDVIFTIYEHLTKLKSSLEFLKKALRKEISIRKKKLEEKPTSKWERENLTDFLLEMQEREADFTDEDVLDQLMAMFVASKETTACAIAFAVVMLGANPDIQDKVFEEMKNQINGKSLTVKNVMELKYLDQVVKETLRLYPSMPLFGRKATKNIPLKSGVIPAGASIIICSAGIHRNPKLFPNPWKFDPDNFLEERVNERHPYSYIPFSGGPRNCLGSTYGILFVKISLITLVRNFVIRTNVSKDVRLKVTWDVTLKNFCGYPVKLYNRK